jgi:S-DNA-T family DNA segregation ATPase FtsK/SpoIIIE
VPGRFVSSRTKLQGHIAAPPGGLDQAVAQAAARWPGRSAKPTVIGRLPTSIAPAGLGAAATLTGEPWRLPVGIGESDLSPAFLETYEGEHVLIAGPVRSGKSSLLLALIEVVRAAAAADGEPIQVWGLCGRRSPLAGAAGLDRVVVGAEEVTELVAAMRVQPGRLVLFIDDAEQFGDDDGAIASLLTGLPGLLIIAAGRADELRTLYTHWTKTLRKSRCGVLLQPNLDYDGDLLGARIPRRTPVALTTGRGYLVSGGEVRFVQCLSPDPGSG